MTCNTLDHLIASILTHHFLSSQASNQDLPAKLLAKAAFRVFWGFSQKTSKKSLRLREEMPLPHSFNSINNHIIHPTTKNPCCGQRLLDWVDSLLSCYRSHIGAFSLVLNSKRPAHTTLGAKRWPRIQISPNDTQPRLKHLATQAMGMKLEKKPLLSIVTQEQLYYFHESLMRLLEAPCPMTVYMRGCHKIPSS